MLSLPVHLRVRTTKLQQEVMRKMTKRWWYRGKLNQEVRNLTLEVKIKAEEQ